MSDLTKELLVRHTFTFPSLSPASGANQQPYIRFLMFIKKRPDITDEKFHLWWSTVHADLAVSVAGFGGHCKRYVQLHQTAEHKRELEKYGMQPLPFDGVGEMYLKSLADWVVFSRTEAFKKNLVGDGANFMDGSLKVMMGYDHLVYGSKFESSNGSDGILPGDSRLTPGPKL